MPSDDWNERRGTESLASIVTVNVTWKGWGVGVVTLFTASFGFQL